MTITTSISGELEEIELSLDENNRFRKTIAVDSFPLNPSFTENCAETVVTAYSGDEKTTVKIKSVDLFLSLGRVTSNIY